MKTRSLPRGPVCFAGQQREWHLWCWWHRMLGNYQAQFPPRPLRARMRPALCTRSFMDYQRRQRIVPPLARAVRRTVACRGQYSSYLICADCGRTHRTCFCLPF